MQYYFQQGPNEEPARDPNDLGSADFSINPSLRSEFTPDPVKERTVPEFDKALSERLYADAVAELSQEMSLSPAEVGALIDLGAQWFPEVVAQYDMYNLGSVPQQFSKLREYYAEELLQKTDHFMSYRCPIFPFEMLNLPPPKDGTSPTAAGWSLPKQDNIAGIAVPGAYFMSIGAYNNESTHLHELVHVVQYEILGPKTFLAVYALGLIRHGYRHSPLEEMAYDLQDGMQKNKPPVDIAAEVHAKLRALDLQE